MNGSTLKLIFRPARRVDAEQVLQLVKRSEVEEYGEPDSSLKDILNDWEQITLESDTWLAFTPEDNLTGYASVMPWTDRLRYQKTGMRRVKQYVEYGKAI
jgi:hypothetical protein